MTTLKHLVELTPPDIGHCEERLESPSMECGYCHGHGSFIYDERWGEDVIRICPVCKGAGRVVAEVTIKWKPSNNINKEEL